MSTNPERAQPAVGAQVEDLTDESLAASNLEAEFEGFGAKAKLKGNYPEALAMVALAVLVGAALGATVTINWLMHSNGVTGRGAVVADVVTAVVVLATGVTLFLRASGERSS